MKYELKINSFRVKKVWMFYLVESNMGFRKLISKKEFERMFQKEETLQEALDRITIGDY